MTVITLSSTQIDEVIIQELKSVFKSHLLERDEGGQLIDDHEMLDATEYLLHYFTTEEDATKFVKQCRKLRKVAESKRTEQRKKLYRDSEGLSGSS